jgi:hypothetical protein
MSIVFCFVGANLTVLGANPAGSEFVEWKSIPVTAIPTDAGIQEGPMPYAPTIKSWMPVFTGMTNFEFASGRRL